MSPALLFAVQKTRALRGALKAAALFLLAAAVADCGGAPKAPEAAGVVEKCVGLNAGRPGTSA